MTISRNSTLGTSQNLATFGSTMAAPLLVHRLFFAVFPDEKARTAIANFADELRTVRDIRGRWVEPSRYHMTLHFLGNDSELVKDRVVRASLAAARIAIPAFDVEVDRLSSFKGRKPPGILCGADAPPAVLALWHALRRELMAAGLGEQVESKFIPHVTLFYGDGTPFEHEAIAPIAWTVREFSLVHSVVGQHDYRVLASWPLSA